MKDYLKLHFAGREYESFVVLYLDAQNSLIEVEELFRGTLTQTSVYPREVVKSALRFNAAAVMFSHNHPSGSVTHSRADEHLTKTLKAASSLVDVRVLDHHVIAGNNALSFAETGLLLCGLARAFLPLGPVTIRWSEKCRCHSVHDQISWLR